jgi:hypothetical protein
MKQARAMRITATLLLAVALAATGARAECLPSSETVRVRISLQPAKNIEVAGVVLSVAYPADTLVIAGRGKEAGRAAVSKTPDGAFTAFDDRDGELRLVVGKAQALQLDPICEITFHRCEGAKRATPNDVSCRVTDASDPATNKLDSQDIRCAVREAS